jgi:hypothetical protein
MIKNLFFKSDINLDTVKVLSDDLEKCGEDSDVVVWFDSQGGNRDAARALASIVDGFPGKLTIKITWAASSCAFLFLLENSRRFEYMPDAFSAVHQVSREVHERNQSDPLGADAILKKGTDQDNENTIGMIRSSLTAEEIDRYNRGDEVILLGERATRVIRIVRLARGLATPPQDRETPE